MPKASLSQLGPEEVADCLARFINANLMAPNHPVQPDDNLESMGIDSLALLRILVFIEVEYGFWMSDEDLVEKNMRSPRALANYICARRKPS